MKIIILGDTSVGKTSLVHRIKHKRVSNFISPTIGMSCSTHQINSKNHSYIFTIYDVSGSERFKNLLSTYAKDVSICFVIFDLSNKTSFDNVESWLDHFKCSNPTFENENSIIYLIGNKMDLESQVSDQDAFSLANIRHMKYKKMSALTGENINTLFLDLVNDLERFENARLKSYQRSSYCGLLSFLLCKFKRS